MPNQEQNIVDIQASELLSLVQDMKNKGYRLGQACASTVEDGVNILYSFDKDHSLTNLKLHVKNGEEVQSITNIIWAAFIYENEMQDLFGVRFKNLALNYGGNFYTVSEPTPWNKNIDETGQEVAAEMMAKDKEDNVFVKEESVSDQEESEKNEEVKGDE